MDVYRTFASAGNNAIHTVLVKAMVMFVLLHQQKDLNKVEKMGVAVSKQSK